VQATHMSSSSDDDVWGEGDSDKGGDSELAREQGAREKYHYNVSADR